MKRFFFILIFTLCFAIPAWAQRFAYVDSEYILKQMPEFASAKRQLDAISAQWQKDVDAKYQEIDRLYKAYQADEVLLTPDVKKRRQAEIADKERTAKEFQTTKFGPGGELEQKSNTLIKPIQDKIAKAVQAEAESENLDIIFDKNSDVILMLYASPRYDKSKDVITRLGLKPAAPAK